MKGKGGSEKALGMSLESLVNQDEAEQRGAPAPEAPAGSFRRRDVESLQQAGENGKPVAQKGIDGKVWGFIAAGSDESDGEAAGKQLAAAKEAKDTQKKKKEKKKKKSSSSDSSSSS